MFNQKTPNFNNFYSKIFIKMLAEKMPPFYSLVEQQREGARVTKCKFL